MCSTISKRREKDVKNDGKNRWENVFIKMHLKTVIKWTKSFFSPFFYLSCSLAHPSIHSIHFEFIYFSFALFSLGDFFPTFFSYSIRSRERKRILMDSKAFARNHQNDGSVKSTDRIWPRKKNPFRRNFGLFLVRDSNAPCKKELWNIVH